MGINCWALSFDGTVQKTKSTLAFLSKSDSKKYKLTGATPIIASYLNKLSDGDFISIDGTRDSVKLTVTVNSINYVGLKSLLGNWYGDDSYCYNFVNNTDFTISQRTGRRCKADNDMVYTYLLNPDSHTSSWVMLIAGDYGSYVGDLKVINPATVSIELYDSETGEVLRYLNLTRVK